MRSTHAGFDNMTKRGLHLRRKVIPKRSADVLTRLPHELNNQHDLLPPSFLIILVTQLSEFLCVFFNIIWIKVIYVPVNK